MLQQTQKFDVVIVGTDKYGLEALGKAQLEFWPRFKASLEDYGARVEIFSSSSEFISSRNMYKNAVLVLVFNESCALAEYEYDELVRVNAAMNLRSERVVVCCSPQAGRIMGNKLSTNIELSKIGVPMPRVVTSQSETEVFTNDLVGAGATVKVGREPQPDRYNTEFVNTLHEFRGKKYYVNIRAMCIGAATYALIVRARDSSEGNPSVHTRDTPHDAKLLNYLEASVLMPRAAAIMEICQLAGEKLGLGFYAYDILPDANRNQVFVNEVGFKFDEWTVRAHLGHMAGELMSQDHLHDRIVSKIAWTFFVQAGRRLNVKF